MERIPFISHRARLTIKNHAVVLAVARSFYQTASTTVFARHAAGGQSIMGIDLCFMIAGRPVPKQRPRFGAGRAYTSTETVAYERAVRAAAQVAMMEAGQKPTDQPVMVTAVFQYAIPRSYGRKKRETACQNGMPCTIGGDVDNLTKSVLDGIQRTIFVDDRQVVRLAVSKVWAEESGCLVRVREFDGLRGES